MRHDTNALNNMYMPVNKGVRAPIPISDNSEVRFRVGEKPSKEEDARSIIML